MELRRLLYFVTPVEALYFGRAAAREHIVQSALSQQLQRLEPKPVLRVGVVDSSYDSMPQILRQKQEQYPELEIHQVEAGAPEQFRQLASGRLDVGIGRASLVPPEVTSELFRLDPLGMLVPEGHRLAASQEVPVAKLAAQLAPSRRSCAGVVGAG